MKSNYLAILLVFITSVCFAGGPEPVVNVNANQIADGSVTASKLDSSDDYTVNSMTLTEKVQAAWADIRGDIYASGSLEIVGDADIGGDLAGVNASFTGSLNASDVISGGDTIGPSNGYTSPYMIRYTFRPTISNDATFKITPDSFNLSIEFSFFRAANLYLFDGSYGKSANYTMSGATTIELIDPGTDFTPTKDNAGTWNVYVESGNIVIQNKTGNAATMRIGFTGLVE
jgi:hypothetical protein